MHILAKLKKELAIESSNSDQKIKEFISKEILKYIDGGQQSFIRKLIFDTKRNWNEVLKNAIKEMPELKLKLKNYNLEANFEEEAGYTEEQWKKLDEKTKKQYIKDHPNSKYAQKDKPSSNNWTDVYNIFENAPFEELLNLRTREDVENFMKKNSLDPKDENVKKAIDKFMEEPDSEEEDNQDYDDGSMTTEEAKKYWDKYHNSDPVLREYTSYEDWYKDSKENGYIKDEEHNSYADRPTSFFDGEVQIDSWNDSPANGGGNFEDDAQELDYLFDENGIDDVKYGTDGDKNYVSVRNPKNGELYNIVIDEYGVDIMDENMEDSYLHNYIDRGEHSSLGEPVLEALKELGLESASKDEADDYDFTSDEPMTTEEAKKYWKKNRTSDPLLEMYDSFEEWYKESKENGYIVDSKSLVKASDESRSVAKTKKVRGNMES